MLLRLDPPRPRSRISLTALIDVVFILLLFFMLTTQFTRWRSLDVPMAQETAEPVDEQPLRIGLDAAGWLSLGEARIAPGSACVADASAVLAGASVPVVLRPQADARVQPIMDALDCLRAAGAAELVLADAAAAAH